MSASRKVKHGLTLVGSTLADRYRIIREIGNGAMGTVYESHHTAIGRRLAIKVLNRKYGTPKAKERFLHEARASGAITHQHIVPVVDFGLLDSGEPYLVMEYADGEPLDRMIALDAPVPVDDAVEICAQILSALEVIHGAGLVHRDIKPANIMMLRVRRPRIFCQLLDFGVSRALHAAWHRPDLTRVHEVLGTPAYFSPEQAAGGTVDPRWDLWAMGSVMYELLSGTLPVELESVEQVLADLVNHRLIPLRRHNKQLPTWVYQVLDRAHHPNIEERYNSAGVFLQALDQQTAYPDGGASDDARTSLFVRVDLNTPPPELLDRFASGSGDTAEVASELASKPFESQITDPDLPSHRGHHWEGGSRDLPQERSSDRVASDEAEEGSETVPIQRAFHEELGDDDKAILVGQITDTDPVRRRSQRPRPWVTVALALLILVATSLIIYFGLLLR